MRFDAVLELSEVRNLLAERMTEWTQEWKQQGLEEGRKAGHKEGRKELGLFFLQELLTEKFGPLDAATLERLKATDRRAILTIE